MHSSGSPSGRLLLPHRTWSSGDARLTAPATSLSAVIVAAGSIPAACGARFRLTRNGGVRLCAAYRVRGHRRFRQHPAAREGVRKVAVVRVDGDIVTACGLVLAGRALSWAFSHSGGPGGQGVNTSDSRVQLTADLTLLAGDSDTVARVVATLGERVQVTCSTERSQLRNRVTARERLAALIDDAAQVAQERVPTRTPGGAVEARLRDKGHRSKVKAGRRGTWS
jgi:ribosome-associated protein